MFKNIYKVTLAILLVLVTHFASADSGLMEILQDVTYTGELTYKNAGRTFNYTHSNDDFSTVIRKAESIQAVEINLRTQLKDAIQKEINGKLSLRNFYFSLDGPIKLVLTGQSNGNIQARFGGFTINTSGKLRKNSLAHGHYSIRSNTLWVNGTYDPFTGKISNISPANDFSFNIHVDIDSIFNLIPGFNFLITNKFERDIENELKSALESKLTASYETMAFGLDDHLPNGVYLYNGTDLAQEVKDSFTDLVSGESISIELSESYYRYRNSVGSYSTFTIDTVSINISDHLFLEFTEKPYFTQRWVCFSSPCTNIDL